MRPPVIDVWNNMTVADLAEAAGRSIDDILEAISYIDPARHNKNTVIDNRNVLYEIVKKIGAKFRVIPNPKEFKEEEKDLDVVKR